MDFIPRRRPAATPRHIALLTILAIGALLAVVPMAGAAGVYPAWTLDESGGVGHETGTVKFGVLGAPDATFSSSYTGCTPTPPATPATDCYVLLDSDPDEEIAASSAWGTVLGASLGKDFLYTQHQGDVTGLIRTTVYTFATPMPASAFNIMLGDIDYDTVIVSAKSKDGTDLSGEQIVGSISPPQTYYFDSTTACTVGDVTVSKNASDVTMSADTGRCGDGSGVWLQPNTAVASFTTISHGSDGGSTIRTWLAVMAHALSGKATSTNTAGAAISGATVTLVDADGTTLGTATTSADGSYSFPLVYARAGYKVSVAAPSGFTAGKEASATVDLSTADGVANLVVTPAATTKAVIVKPTLTVAFAAKRIIAGNPTTLIVTYRNPAGSVGKATIAITLPDSVAFSSSTCAKRSKTGAIITVKSLGKKAATCRITVTTSGLERARVTAKGTLTPAADTKKTAKGSGTLVILPLPEPKPEIVTG